MEVVDDDLLFADGAVLLFDKPVFDAVAVVKVFALENGDVFVLVDFVVTNTAYLFSVCGVLVFGVEGGVVIFCVIFCVIFRVIFCVIVFVLCFNSMVMWIWVVFDFG
jgi:hypothetical protein